MDDELAALNAEITNEVPEVEPEEIPLSPNVTATSDQISHDDNDIHMHMQALDESGNSVPEPPTIISPTTTSVGLDIDHHIDTIEEVIIESTDEIIASVTLFSPSKAVLSTPVEPNEQDEMFHEEEVTRVLTTLESAKKREDPPIEDQVDSSNNEEVDSSVAIKTDNASLDTSNASETSQAEDVRELARRQLATIAKLAARRGPKKQQANNSEKVEKKTAAVKPMKVVKDKKAQANYVTPKNKIKTESVGTIEIPKELISGEEELHTSVLLNSGTPLKSEDLLAILEGSDDEMSGDSAVGRTSGLDRETEKKLALEQILTLPPKLKGRRPKPKPAAEEAKKPVVVKKSTTTKELVQSLVMDWSGGSDSESKTDEIFAEQPPKKLNPLPKKQQPVVVAKSASQDNPIAFKRSRIIKKKIIWDPDAPETAVSYASLIQPSAAFIKKTQSNLVGNKKPVDSPPPRILNKIPAQHQEPKEVKLKRTLATPSPTTLKKRKISEIDRLLGDEGAVNMLNALKQENNNTDSSEQEISPETLTAAERKQRAAASPATGHEEKYNPRQPRIKRPQTPQTIVQPIKKEPVKRKKTTVSTDSNSWDYIYSKRGEEALIIRRRSNSSYSSSASNTRLSIDSPNIQAALTKTGKAPAKAGRPRKENPSFEFAKPNARKSVQSTTDEAPSTILLDIRRKSNAGKLNSSTLPPGKRPASSGRDSTTSDEGSESSITIQYKPTPKEKKPVMIKVDSSAAKPNATSKASKSKPIYQEIRLERKDGVAHIVLAPFSDQLENVFTVQVSGNAISLLFDFCSKIIFVSTSR